MTVPLFRTEVLIGGVWTPMPVLNRDNITIKRGRSSESATVAPTRLNLTVDNRSGRYNPRDPSSDLYGRFGRSTPIRVWTRVDINTNPTFEDPHARYGRDPFSSETLGWLIDPSSASLERTTERARSGKASGLVTVGSHNRAVAYMDAESPELTGFRRMPVEGDVDYDVTGWLYSPLGWNPVEVRVSFENEDGDTVTPGFDTEVSVPAGEWTQVSVSGTAPSDAVFAGVAIEIMDSPPEGEELFLDDFSFSRADESEFIRFAGEISSMQPRESNGGVDRYINLEANGITSRIDQGTRVVSMLRRSLEAEQPEDLHAYWPLEDGEDATRFAAFTDNTSAATFSGDVELAAYDGFDASSPIPVINEGTITARVSQYSSPGPSGDSHNTIMNVLLRTPDDVNHLDYSDWLRLLDIRTTGFVARTVIYIGRGDEQSGDDSGRFHMQVFDEDGNILNEDDPDQQILYSITPSDLELSDLWEKNYIIQVAWRSDNTLPQSINLQIREANSDDQHTVGPSFDEEYGRVAAIKVNSGSRETGSFDTGSGLAVGHMGLWKTDNERDFRDLLSAHDGEYATDRIERIANEEGIPNLVFGGTDFVERLGPQRPGTTMELFRESAAADGGIFIDSMADPPAVRYWSRESTSGQVPALELDWSTGVVMPPFRPAIDDQRIRNDIELSRPGGSSARVVRAEGALSVQDPPDGVGRFDERRELNVYTDDQLDGLVQWWLHRGTLDEPRFPEITVSLLRDPDLIRSLPEVAHRLTVINVPARVSPHPLNLLVEGYSETISVADWRVTFQTSPYEPFRKGRLDNDDRLDADGLTLNSQFDAGTDTTLVITGVDLGAAYRPAFTQDSAEYPFVIDVLGVLIEVTAAAAPSGDTQDLTVTQEPVNGVHKSLPAGASAQVFRPMKLGLGEV